jgi:hypothetical protein
VAAEGGGDVVVAGLGVLGAVEDNAGTEGQALRSGVGLDELPQLIEFLEGEVNTRGFASHDKCS